MTYAKLSALITYFTNRNTTVDTTGYVHVLKRTQLQGKEIKEKTSCSRSSCSFFQQGIQKLACSPLPPPSFSYECTLLEKQTPPNVI